MYVYDEQQNKWVLLRTTAQYKKKKKIVRDLWLMMGLLMVPLPVAFTLALALLTTFLSFVVLDESLYRHPVRS